jgi:hypothetical protein
MNQVQASNAIPEDCRPAKKKRPRQIGFLNLSTRSAGNNKEKTSRLDRTEREEYSEDSFSTVQVIVVSLVRGVAFFSFFLHHLTCCTIRSYDGLLVLLPHQLDRGALGLFIIHRRHSVTGSSLNPSSARTTLILGSILSLAATSLFCFVFSSLLALSGPPPNPSVGNSLGEKRASSKKEKQSVNGNEPSINSSIIVVQKIRNSSSFSPLSCLSRPPPTLNQANPPLRPRAKRQYLQPFVCQLYLLSKHFSGYFHTGGPLTAISAASRLT